MFDKFIERLGAELMKPLPGIEAQLKMAPAFRQRLSQTRIEAKDPKESAVLILLFPTQNSIHTVLILRPSYAGVHSGQIGFPGGKLERDEDPMHASLREAEEEIGIDRGSVTVIGRLTQLYIPPSNFLVHPFIGYCQKRPGFVAAKNEVEKIIEVGINELLADEIVSAKKLESTPFGTISTSRFGT